MLKSATNVRKKVNSLCIYPPFILFFWLTLCFQYIENRNMKRIKIHSLASLWLLVLLCGASCASRKPVQQSQIQSPASALVETLTQIEAPPTKVVLPPEKKEQPAAIAPSPAPQLATGDWENDFRTAMDALCNNDSLAATSQIGVYVYDLTQGAPLYARNHHHRMRPASCQKLVTAISALHYLGPQYKLRTTVQTMGRVSGGTLQGDLYVVGGMDPLLTAAEVDKMVQALKMAGIRRVAGRVCKDVSMTDGEPYGWGWCWDDDYGPLSALLVDGKDNFSAVWMRSMARHGIAYSGPDTLQIAVCPAEATLRAVAEHDVQALLQTMMKESDNIYAECLFYQLAAHGGTKKAGRKHAARLITELIEKNAGQKADALCVADGSGLSLYNYLTPHLLTSFLQLAQATPEMYAALLRSLPVAGVDGTLEKRMRQTPAYRRVWAKTGSVSGISSLSGYAQAANGHLLAFTIINQGVVRTKHGREFQDKVCELMCK